jgi:hypothetical protein
MKQVTIARMEAPTEDTTASEKMKWKSTELGLREVNPVVFVLDNSTFGAAAISPAVANGLVRLALPRRSAPRSEWSVLSIGITFAFRECASPGLSRPGDQCSELKPSRNSNRI